MKNYFGIICCVLAGLVGCSKEAQWHQEEECLVSFNLVGEITSSEMPLTKGSTDDLYIVQVYNSDSAFASGFFDDVKKISLNLKKGSKYRIIVSMLKGGKTLLSSMTSDDNNPFYREDVNGVNCEYYGAFVWYNSSTGGSYYLPVNSCYYNSIGEYDIYYADSTPRHKSDYKKNEFKNIGKGMIYKNKYPKCDDWLYGEINNYAPVGKYETVNLDLKRVGFKLQCEVNGITDGTVTVKISNSTKTFFNQSISSSTYTSNPVFYAFYDAYSAWKYADDYSENFTLAVTWKRGIGITEDYGTKTIQLRRNCLNNIKISMGNNDQSAGMSIRMEAESSIGSDNVSIPVQ